MYKSPRIIKKMIWKLIPCILGLIILGSCAPNTVKPTEESPKAISMENDFSEIQREIPEFAGIYLDKFGIFTISLTKYFPSQITDKEVIAIARKHLNTHYLDSQVNILRGANYSLSQLNEWQNKIFTSISGVSDITGIGISILDNQIHILIKIDGSESQLRRIIENNSIPGDAFSISEAIIST